MSNVRKGDKVQAKVRHSGVKAGAVGTVTGVYQGTFFAVNYPGVDGISYSPATHCDATTGGATAPVASGGGGVGAPAPPAEAALVGAQSYVERVSAWDRIMGFLTSGESGGGVATPPAV